MISYLSVALLVLLPFQFALSLGTEWDIPLARLLAATVMASFLVGATLRRSWDVPTPLFTGVLLSFLGISLASCLWAQQPGLAFPKIVFLLNLLPLIFVWYDFMRSDGQRQRLVRALVYGATGAGIVGISIFLSQFLFGVGEVFHFLIDRILPIFLGRELSAQVAAYPSLMVNIDGETVLRTTAFFPDPHVAAYFFGMSGFLALGLAKESGRRSYAVAAAALFLADIPTFSRGGYFGLISGGVAYLFAISPTLVIRKKLRLSVVGLAAIFIILISIGQPVASRFFTSFSLTDTSSIERLALWKEALAALSVDPIWGVGLGNYLAAARPLSLAGTPFYAHNLYLDIALEIGIAGLLVFLIFFFIAFARALSAKRIDAFSPAVAAVLALYLAHSVFETALFSLHVTLVLAFTVALALRLKQPIA